MSESVYTFRCDERTDGLLITTNPPDRARSRGDVRRDLKGVAMHALKNARILIADCQCEGCEAERENLDEAIARLATAVGSRMEEIVTRPFGAFN